jgi:hypothetical protein
MRQALIFVTARNNARIRYVALPSFDRPMTKACLPYCSIGAVKLEGQFTSCCGAKPEERSNAMKKIMIVAALLSALMGLVSAVQAKHVDWTKNFWDQQDRQSGGG